MKNPLTELVLNTWTNKFPSDAYAHPGAPESFAREAAAAVIEQIAQDLEDKAALEINSLCCGDNSPTIDGVHRVARTRVAIARELREKKP